MLDGISWIIIVLVILSLMFDFINGFHDIANSVATSVSTRVLTPKQAIVMASILNFLGATMSSKVAKTISSGFIDSTKYGQSIIIATLIAAITWNLLTWYYAIPSSSSHALIGGLLGAAITFAGGFGNVQWNNIAMKVLVPLILAPILGLVMGYFLMNLFYEILRPFSQRLVNKWFSKLQILSAAFMAFSHGSNDAQKSMGIITLGLISGGLLPIDADVPAWVVVSCATAMAIGTSVGGYKIIKTIGMNMIKLQPVGGFTAQTGAALVIEAMTFFGSPVSTTHVISSSIMGVGAAKRISAVRWTIARNILWAWGLTIPITAFLGATIALIMKHIIQI